MVKEALELKASCLAKKRYVQMVKLNKNRSENVLAFVSTRARSGSRPKCYKIISVTMLIIIRLVLYIYEYCFTSLSAQSWQYRDRRRPEAGTMPESYFE